MQIWPTPDKEGFFWAQWTYAVDSDPTIVFPPHWEVVEVYQNEADGPQRYRVFVGGIEHSYPLDGFRWGPEAPRPPELTEG